MKEIRNIILIPLTYLLFDSKEVAALTTNHFIYGDWSDGHPIGHFSGEAKILS